MKKRQLQQPTQTYNSSPHFVTSNVGVYVYTLRSKDTRRRLNVLDDTDVNAGDSFQVDIVKEATTEGQTWVEKTVHKPKAVVRKTSISNDSVIDHRVLPWNLRSRSNLPWVLRSFSVSCKINAQDEDKKRLSNDSCATVKRPRKKVKEEDIKCHKKITTNESLQHKLAVFDERSNNSNRTLRELNKNVSDLKNNLPHLPTVPEVKTIPQPISKPTKISNGTMVKKQNRRKRIATVKRPREKVKKEDIKCHEKITTNESLQHKLAVFDEHSTNSTRTLRERNQNVSDFKNNLPHLPTVPEVKTVQQPLTKPTAISNGTMEKKQNRKKRIATVNDADSSKENESKPIKIARRGTKRFKEQLKEHLERTTKGGSDDLLATTPHRNRIIKLPMIPHIDSPIILDDMEAVAEFNGGSTPRSEFTCPTPVSIKATPVYRSYLSPLVTVRRLPARSYKSKLKHPSLKMTNKKAAQDRKWEKSLQKLIVQQLSYMKKSEEEEGQINDDDEEDHSNDEYDE